MTIEDQFARARSPFLECIASELQEHLSDLLLDEGVERVDRVSARAKEVKSFLKKAQKETSEGVPKYSSPFKQIQDQIGARITVFFKSDVEIIHASIVKKYFTPIESVDKIPERESEFGYFGKHFVLTIPSNVMPATVPTDVQLPTFFELQIKTLFQHAWSEANHDLGYKTPEGAGPMDMRRRLAFASAQAWGADRIFDELFKEIIGDEP